MNINRANAGWSGRARVAALIVVMLGLSGVGFAAEPSPAPPTSASAMADQLALLHTVPSMRDPILSPDGGRVAVMVRRGNLDAIMTVDIATGATSVIGGEDSIATWATWIGRDEILVKHQKLLGKKDEWTARDLRTGKDRDMWKLTRNPGLIERAVSGSPGRLLLSYRRDLRWSRLDTFKTERAAPDAPVTGMQWLVDDEGHPRVGYGNSSERIVIMWRELDDKAWTERRYDYEEVPWWPLALDRDPRYFWALETQAQPGLARGIVCVDTHSGEVVRALRRPEGEPTRFVWDGTQGRLLGAWFGRAANDQHFLAANPVDGAIMEALSQRLRGYDFEVFSAPRDASRWAVVAGNSRQPDLLLLVDRATAEFSVLGRTIEADFDRLPLAAAESFQVAARSGGSRSGMIWRPAGVDRPPLVVMVPSRLPALSARDRFDLQVQSLVLQGFAVAFVDARGTRGESDEFERATIDAPAQTLAEDYDDVVDGLASRGWIDPGRVILHGQSLGGSLAIAVGAASRTADVVVAFVPAEEISRVSVRNLTTNLSKDEVEGQLGGWRGLRTLAHELSFEQVAPRLRVPLILVSRESRLLGGRPDEYGRRLESILASVPAGGRHVLVPNFRPEEVSVADVARMRAEYWLKLGQAIREIWPTP